MSWYVPAFELWLHVTIAGLALTAAASLALLVIRQPARKIRVIQLALVGLLALPALALLPGYPRVAWWPAVADIEPVALQTKSPPAKPGATPELAQQRDQPSALPGGSSSAPTFDLAPPERASLLVDSVPGANDSTADAQTTQPVVTAPIAATPIKTAPSHSTPPAVVAPREPARFTLPTLPDYRLLILSAYLLGVALFALWWLIGRVALWRLVRTATQAAPDVRTLLNEAAANQAGQIPTGGVRLLVSPRAAQPCAFGWVRPTIVLPERVVKELAPEQLRLALSHEWSHVARGDIRTWMLAGLVRLMHFHQPLLWLLRRELRVSQDYLADAAAASDSTPEDYAELLTTLSRMLRPTPLSPGLGIAPRQSDLYRRVVMLVDQSRPLERTIPRRWNFAAMMLGIALIAGVATLRAEPEESKSEPAEIPTATEALPAARQEDADKMRQEFEAEVAKLRDDIAGLRMTRDYLKQQAEKQILTKERDRIRKQIIPIDQQLAELKQKLDNRWNQLASQLAGQTPATNPYEKQETLVTESATKERPSRDDPNRNRSQPFSGRIRAGDILGIEIIGGFPGQVPPRTVEPDGRIVVSSAYTSDRCEVADLNLTEAGEAIAKLIRPVLKNEPKVLVTYEGHNDGVVAEGQPEERLGIQLAPQQLAEMILQNDPQINELKRTLAKRELALAQARSSGATPELLKSAHQEVLQIEELIEELKSHRMPALLELVGGSSTQANPRAVGSQPFSGRIRAGDILGIEIVGGFPGQLPPTRTVEPDGNIVLGAVYGPASRVNVVGQTLIEAGQTITDKLKTVLKDPKVVVTYEGHNDGVVAQGAPAAAASTHGKPAPAAEPVLLQPLDTIEIILPLARPRVHVSDIGGTPGEIYTGDNPRISGTYLIEPDGRVALPDAGGRVKLGGLTETEASATLRKHLAEHVFPRVALPTTQVLRRGRAVFPDGKTYAADCRITPGDKLLLSTNFPPPTSVTVGADGSIALDGESGTKVAVAGLSLEEAQALAREGLLSGGGAMSQHKMPWIVTLGGWREEADPRVIDLIEGVGATQLLRMQEEMQELKAMIRRLQAE